MHNLLDNVQITTIAGCTGAALPATTFLNMDGWDGCMFVLKGTTSIDSSGPGTLQYCTGTSTAGAWTSTHAIHMTTFSNQAVGVIDVVRPLRQYLRLVAKTCTGVDIVAIQYNARRAGSTQARVNLMSFSTIVVVTS